MKWYHKVDWNAITVSFLLIIAIILFLISIFKGCI